MEDTHMTRPSASQTIRLLVAIALGGLVITLSGIVLFRPLPTAAQGQAQVSIVEPDRSNASSWKFDPHDITVKAGTTVAWEWKGQDKHSVTADDGSFDSGVKQGMGQRWEYRFDAPGDFPYSCTPHSFMTGKVTVTP
jgi:plastocyanin